VPLLKLLTFRKISVSVYVRLQEPSAGTYSCVLSVVQEQYIMPGWWQVVQTNSTVLHNINNLSEV